MAKKQTDNEFYIVLTRNPDELNKPKDSWTDEKISEVLDKVKIRKTKNIPRSTDKGLKDFIKIGRNTHNYLLNAFLVEEGDAAKTYSRILFSKDAERVTLFVMSPSELQTKFIDRRTQILNQIDQYSDLVKCLQDEADVLLDIMESY